MPLLNFMVKTVEVLFDEIDSCRKVSFFTETFQKNNRHLVHGAGHLLNVGALNQM